MNYHVRKCIAVLLACTLFFPSAVPANRVFDFDTGNAPLEVIFPTLIPVILDTLSPAASDPSIIFRVTALVTNGWFDAIAPYHATALGIYSTLPGHQVDNTNKKKNIAILYASYRILNNLFPKQKEVWDKMLESLSLDPGDNSENPYTPIGIGNIAGRAVISNREHDGMNQLGDEGGRMYHRAPYADYLGYKPVNTAYRLLNPSRWQPDIVTAGNGIFHVQQFVTPQLRVTRPYSYADPNNFRAPFPRDSQVQNLQAYKRQADEVLAASAALTDEQKIKAELFNSKFSDAFAAVPFLVNQKTLSLQETVYLEFLTNMASFDTAIAVWNEKYRYDAVRPFSAIRFLYKDHPVIAWGGPGQGTVTIPANEWRSYLDVGNHPEYPSGTASFCSAQAQVIRRFFNADDHLGLSLAIAKGSSKVEPGITPARDIVLTWQTLTELEEDCGLSRLWGGVHFRPSIGAGHDIGHTIGDLAYEFVRNHIDARAH